MFCTRCGKEMAADSLFCPYCGQKKTVVAETQAPAEEEKSLVRPRNGRWLGGVAAGMADYFGRSAAGFRVFWVVMTVVTFGLVAIAYLVLCFVIPDEK